MSSGLRWSQDDFDAYRKRIETNSQGVRPSQSEFETASAYRAVGYKPDWLHIAPESTESDFQARCVSRTASRLETLLAQQMKAWGIPKPYLNYKPIEGRKLEIDFAWPMLRRGIEVQGSVHRIKAQYGRDMEKAWALWEAGWTVLPLDSKLIRSGEGVALVAKLLGA